MRKIIERLDKKLAEILANTASATERFVSASFRDIERETRHTIPRLMKTRLNELCAKVATRKVIVAIREKTVDKIDEISRTLDNIERDLSGLTRIDAPDYTAETAAEIGLDADAVKCLSDEAWIATLAKAHKVRDVLKRMSCYLRLVLLLSEAMERTKARVAKLTERMRQDSGAEGSQAMEMRRRLNAVVELLWKRREVAARMFFLQRRKILSWIVCNTATFDRAWPTPSVSLSSLVRKPDVDAERPLRILSDMDAAHKRVPMKMTRAAEREAR